MAVARAATRAPVAMRDVIVTMRRQAPLPAGPASRGRAPARVERALQRTAAAGQRHVIALLERRRASGEVRTIRRFWIVNALQVVATPRVVAELAADPDVASVRPNAVLRTRARAVAAAAPTAPPADNVALIGAPALWRSGMTGSGVTVASLDSGVDASHPALAAAFRDGRGGWFDPSGQHATPVDTSGHGTATMGVIVGGGAGGTTLGVAPDARWIAAKVFDDRGKSSVARIHAAFQWLLDPDGRPGTADAPQVVNASWNRASGGCDLEFEDDLRHLRAAGIVTVFASGNDAQDASPANDPSAFAVGSVDAAGAVAPDSGRGRSSCGGPVYPNLVAPGVDIPTTDVAGLYTTQTGTSVAAPHVTGALALLLSRFPRTSALRQQSALEAGAADLGARGPDDVFGFGRLDVAASYHWLVTARDHTLTPERWSITARAGRSASLRLKLGAVHGFTGPVRVTVEGLPTGASASALRVTLRGASRDVRLRVATTPRVRAGTTPVIVVARAGDRSRRLTVRLVVLPR